MYLSDKNILVTGVCGTVGKELVKQILSGKFGKIKELVGIDNNESELFFTQQEFGSKTANFYLRDLRDYGGVRNVMEGIDIVFHAAALKHVGICEISPNEAVSTNIVGLQNLIKAAKCSQVERFIFTSSDKAVNPTNVMGTSKLMGERLVSAANNSRENKGTIFTSTRFGNVLGSRGSVIPIFKKQIQSGQSVTLTDREMTRFIMTIDEAANLVLDSGQLAVGGEVFITKMPVCRIEDIANVMVDVYAEQGIISEKPAVTEIGVKPGEKLYEELMSHEEMHRSIETKQYFVVKPAFRDMYDFEYKYDNVVSEEVNNPYNSSEEPAMSVDELKAYLLKHSII
ncbi:polysaccharide biosynthesis protein [Motilimonas pumila]|uniref:Polysaccharide biosynthesis protein n=1 Tax=Motilimonas pumila TaxID=2303987 RepID=A0A418YDU1_9GAMM|nr:polysaccharide biosynthesis protein [Motilimonas pumila]RJG42702.1 polysaccharide biosynthesis protein [Motilimonas pumila]